MALPKHPPGPPMTLGNTLKEMLWLACSEVATKVGSSRFHQALLHVRRVKAGTPSTHPLTGAELRALRRLHREASLRSYS